MPDDDGFITVPLPCGHADEAMTPFQAAAARSFRTACPVCGVPCNVVVINEHELRAAGLLQGRELSPGGLTVVVCEDRPGQEDQPSLPVPVNRDPRVTVR